MGSSDVGIGDGFARAAVIFHGASPPHPAGVAMQPVFDIPDGIALKRFLLQIIVMIRRFQDAQHSLLLEIRKVSAHGIAKHKTDNDAIDRRLVIMQKALKYCGDVINFKTYSKSFKNKQRFLNPEENWVVFRDRHEPIIDRESFLQVQQRLEKTKRRAPKTHNGEKHLLADYLYCADCHSKLWYHTNTVNKDIHYFSCSNYKTDYRGTCPTRHYIRADAIEQVVTLELRRLAAFVQYDEKAFAELLAEKTDQDVASERKQLEAGLQRALSRSETVVRLYEKLYEDNATGKVTDEWFMQLSHRYEVERLELKGKIAGFREQIKSLDSAKKGRDLFLRTVRGFMEMQTLTAPLLQELIDHIDVYETEGKGKDRTQRVVIYYRFVGHLELTADAFV